jgi:hypothetical protein
MNEGQARDTRQTDRDTSFYFKINIFRMQQTSIQTGHFMFSRINLPVSSEPFLWPLTPFVFRFDISGFRFSLSVTSQLQQRSKLSNFVGL